MYMPCIISYDICNFLYSNETHIWRYGWTLQVLRSAPLMMMMMDVEDQFKTKWKRRWRKAISGDPDKRIRDHMDDKEVQKRIRLVDTASFTLGKTQLLCGCSFCLLKIEFHADRVFHLIFVSFILLYLKECLWQCGWSTSSWLHLLPFHGSTWFVWILYHHKINLKQLSRLLR